MKLRQSLLAVGLSLGLVGVVTSISQPASAATDNSQYYRTYKSIPKVLRGTWQTKGYMKYQLGGKVNWTYTFNQNSYAMTLKYKGNSHKGKTVKFNKKDISYIDYRYATKRYEITPFTKDQAKRPYAGILYLKPVTHNGKKALADYPIVGTKITYFYKK